MVHRVIDSAQRCNLTSLPDDVADLWATILAWFCASPNRKIRDLSTKAMTRIFVAKPAIVPSLLSRFVLIDDEYVSERVLVSSYGALLISKSEADLRRSAVVVYESLFSSGQPPFNASLRDHARLIIELAIDLKVGSTSLDPARYRPPYRSPWPLHLPSEEDVRPFAEDHDRFPEMNLIEYVGMATGTDFARYVVEPRIFQTFDMKKAGIEKLAVFRWFIMEAASLGYPGPKARCALFDHMTARSFGSGRGKPGWAERLGKKYYWIFLRRLVGILSDHVDREDWEKSYPPSDDLQGLDLRDIDPTDLRSSYEGEYPSEVWLNPSPYHFGAPDEVSGDASWARDKGDLPSISEALIPIDPDGVKWHAADVATSWRGSRSDRRVKSYRLVQQHIDTLLCAEVDVERVVRAFKRGTLDISSYGPKDYRGYLAEFPHAFPYRARKIDPILFTTQVNRIRLEFLKIDQLRGGEWERDYSEKLSHLMMPSPKLVNFADLVWDGCGSWFDSKGIKRVTAPRWRSDDRSGLLIQLDYLDDYLAATGSALVIFGFQMKFVAGSSEGRNQLEEQTMFVRSQGRCVERHRKLSKF